MQLLEQPFEQVPTQVPWNESHFIGLPAGLGTSACSAAVINPAIMAATSVAFISDFTLVSSSSYRPYFAHCGGPVRRHKRCKFLNRRICKCSMPRLLNHPAWAQ